MNDRVDPSREWKDVPAGLRLSPAHVDVWRCLTTLAAEVIARFEAVLAADERRKADWLRDPAKRVESIVARGVLRNVLGAVLGRGPREFEFSTGPQGKPYLMGDGGTSNVRFNVSHTSGVVVVAATEGADVGVDVERVRADFAWQPVVRQFFPTEEAEALLSLPETEGRTKFFESWVRKEALLKAAGVGMTRGIGPEETGGTVEKLDVGAGYVGAVAVLGASVSVRRWEF